MTVTVTDLFCGAGGSSLGATAAGARLVMAANHWQTAIDVHQSHFPDAAHDCADISQAVPMRRNGHAAPTDRPVPTVTAGGNHHGLLMRNNTGGAEMVTPLDEPARAMTTKGHQSLLVPEHGADVDALVDRCGFRMLEPYEVAAAMAFPEHYIPRSLPKKDQVKLAGNAVTPPVMTWILGRVLQALEAAS